MVKKRTISKSTYLWAFVITSIIFILGVLVGLVIEGKRVAFVESQIREQSLDYSSLQLQFEYVDQLSQENSCQAIEETFDKNVETLEQTRIRLENFDENAAINQAEFEVLQREYTQAQIRYWLLAKRSQDLCESDTVTILYFFTESKDCPDCDEQAFVLTYLKKLFGDKLLTFAFDETLEGESMIEILKNSNNISSFPAIIVQNNSYHGFTSKDVLIEDVCSRFEDAPIECGQ